MTDETRPFQVDIPRQEVERLKRKLEDTRLPPGPIVPAQDPNTVCLWSHNSLETSTNHSAIGPEYYWAKNLFEAWKDDCDWYQVQTEINEYPHCITTIEDLDIHFLHVRAERDNAIPLLAIHGWPGSFWEFGQAWGPLSHPENAKDVAFNVVVPSLPGFCWSSWPPRSGWTLADTARIFDKLMKRLGYGKYMFQCGDWGYFVGRQLGSKYKGSCVLLHTNFAPSPLPEGAQSTEREKAVAGRVDDWLQNHMGYAICMRTRPHTVNPLGILMWVGEKYNEAADPNSQKKPFWTKTILTRASLYYFTGCIMPSMLCYYENVREHFAEIAVQPENGITIPFGYKSHYWDTEPCSERAVERTGHLVFYPERNDGGHFAALECPQGIAEDCRELAAKYWK